jgi:hypothetical protein
MPVGALVYQLIQSAIGAGLRHEDFLSLYELQAAGVALHTEHSPEPPHLPEPRTTSEE